MGIILAILLFSFLIIFHELGHFIMAKINGIRVYEFALGLGPTLIGKEFKGTKFCLKLIPFGGECVMGEDDPDDQAEDNFNSKSVWARISVVAAGPIFNILLGLILCVIMVAWIGYMPTVVGEVEEGYAAAEQGIERGDVITKIDGKSVHLWDELSLYNMMHQDSSQITLTYERDGESHTVSLDRRQSGDDDYARIGIISQGGYEKAGFFNAIKYGFYTARYWVNYTFDCLRMLVTGQIGIRDMSGVVGIVSVVDETYQSSRSYGVASVVLSLMDLMILLTINLGIMNLLPIPALDGGRLVFLIIEAIRKKRLPVETESTINFVGMMLLMALMVVILFSDMMKIFNI